MLKLRRKLTLSLFKVLILKKKYSKTLIDLRKKPKELRLQLTRRLVKRCKKILMILTRESQSTQEHKAPLCGSWFSLPNTVILQFHFGLKTS